MILKLQGVSQQLPCKKSTQFIVEKGYEKNEHSIPEVIHCSFVGDSVLSIVSSFKTLVKANSQVLIFKKLKSILFLSATELKIPSGLKFNPLSCRRRRRCRCCESSN